MGQTVRVQDKHKKKVYPMTEEGETGGCQNGYHRMVKKQVSILIHLVREKEKKARKQQLLVDREAKTCSHS